MRVLRVLTRPNGGGPVRHLGALERELRRQGAETLFLVGRCRPGEVDATGRLREDGAEPQLLDALRAGASPADLFQAARALSARIRRFRPDVIHSHTAAAGVAGRLAAPPGVVVVHTFHGHTLHGGYWGPLRTRLVLAAERFLARRTDLLIAVSQKVRMELEAAGLQPRKGWACLSPQPDPPALRGIGKAAARAELALPEGSPVLLFAGRLERVKGLDLLLTALPAVTGIAGRSAPARLLVLGAGREEGKLRAQAAPLGERVRFLGWQKNLEPAFAAADLGVLPSRNEGWPLFLADAAYAGLPVVATDVGGCREALEELGHGLLVAPGDPAVLARAIRHLLQDPVQRTRLGQRGRRNAALRPGPAEAARRHLELYEALLSGRFSGEPEPRPGPGLRA